jgi:hypothetical protein
MLACLYFDEVQVKRFMHGSAERMSGAPRLGWSDRISTMSKLRPPGSDRSATWERRRGDDEEGEESGETQGGVTAAEAVALAVTIQRFSNYHRGGDKNGGLEAARSPAVVAPRSRRCE